MTPDTAPETQQARVRSPKRSYRHSVLMGAAYLIYVALLFWGGWKLFWWWRYGMGITQSPSVESVWATFYPELFNSGVLRTNVKANDGYYDVLFLGGSVLEQTVPELEHSLRDQLGDRVRIFNLAKAAHTSRDSFIKHSHLGDRHFDLVIFYHGINDARMNRCPDDAFCRDYSHYAWYSGFQQRLGTGRMVIADILAKSLHDAQKPGPEDKEWAVYGDRVKTADSFRQNLEPIVKAAEDRHCPILLMTFAYDLPANYTEEAFNNHRLGYGHGRHSSPVSVWGSPTGVKGAIDAHNKVVREVAARHKNVLFVDQQEMLPANGAHFTDICHLTDLGIRVFTRNIIDAIQGDISRWKSANEIRSNRR